MFSPAILEKLLDRFKEPALVFALVVILLMFQLIRMLMKQRDAANARLATEISENTKTLSRMTVILDLICQRVMK